MGLRNLLLFVLLVFISCTSNSPEELILFDFETDAELDRIHWKCFTLFSLSDEHVTHGAKSLRMELYPSSWPGWTPMLEVNDWHKYNAISFDLYNPEDEEIPVAVRIDDIEDYPDFADRYNQRFILKPGINNVQIPFETLLTSGTKRPLDLGKIYRFLIFMGHPERKYVLYLDYVRLVL